jgi:hypothetical protein
VSIADDDPRVPERQRCVGDTDVTVAELRAAFGLLRAEGLGTTAELWWGGPSFDGSALAWGSTPAAAVSTLRDAIATLWPAADVVDRLAARVVGPWLPGTWREEAGVAIAAPITTAPRPRALLRVGGHHIGAELVVDDGLDWIADLRAALGRNPASLARRFAHWHGHCGRPANGDWSRRVGGATGAVRPAGAIERERRASPRGRARRR